MIILSQNKTACVPFEKGFAYIADNRIKWGNNVAVNTCDITLGQYQSEDDAKTVLEDMLDAYNMQIYHIYTMPKYDCV